MVAILLVPQAIAYAYLAGMPPQYGLYAALIPILLYAFFGTSPHVAIGPVAISAILVLAGVSQIAKPFSPEYISLVILVGFLIGILQLLLGAFKKGNLVNLLSFPVIVGFTSAASIIIISSQLNHVLGIDAPQFESFWKSIQFLTAHLTDTHLVTLIIAIVSILFIVVTERVSRKIPGRLILVVAGIILSYMFGANTKGVEIIEFVPSGLPGFEVPTFSVNAIISLLPTVIVVSLIGVLESIGIAKALENKNDFYEINTNQELIALGISKIGGSFFSALPSSASFSRSAILHQSRARTNIASLITVLFVIISLLFLTQYLFYLPKVILAVIIIYAVKNLFEYHIGKHLFKLHKFDFVVMLITFLSTLVIGLELGVLIGLFISFFTLQTTKKSTFKAFTNIFSQNYQKDIILEEPSNSNECARLIICDNLHFGNAYYLKDFVNDRIIHNEEISVIEIDFKQHCDMDSSALKAMKESLRALHLKDKTYTILNANDKLNLRLKNAHIRLSNSNP